ncbi:uncharacterized protein LOC123498756 [Portunus trituberculatus]|uniref:uncharacterized protein LOC123498756 n=1 Tax=Portunus trituberculatus TaxID=210409 RepID=UPI001E1CDD87|nr:uncharacterized protein LOC123498756 [Portunus trituberculatus]
MGGYSCNHKTDGEKYVCHDPPVYARGPYCLVYSVGAGHDFSFDTHMARFGCEVFTFDDDRAHSHYPTHIRDRLWFYKIRIGTHFVKQHYFSSSSSSTEPQILHYAPLPAVRARLGHQNNHIHFLKVDIEGDEWSVLEGSLFETNILQETQQVGLEVHLDGLRTTGNKTQPTLHLITVARRYLRVLKGLKQRGFHLTHWEANQRGRRSSLWLA